MTGAIVATSLVLWPVAPFFLFKGYTNPCVCSGRREAGREWLPEATRHFKISLCPHSRNEYARDSTDARSDRAATEFVWVFCSPAKSDVLSSVLPPIRYPLRMKHLQLRGGVVRHGVLSRSMISGPSCRKCFTFHV
jgi:hypothetical protein